MKVKYKVGYDIEVEVDGNDDYVYDFLHGEMREKFPPFEDYECESEKAGKLKIKIIKPMFISAKGKTITEEDILKDLKEMVIDIPEDKRENFMKCLNLLNMTEAELATEREDNLNQEINLSKFAPDEDIEESKMMTEEEKKTLPMFKSKEEREALVKKPGKKYLEEKNNNQ